MQREIVTYKQISAHTRRGSRDFYYTRVYVHGASRLKDSDPQWKHAGERQQRQRLLGRQPAESQRFGEGSNTTWKSPADNISIARPHFDAAIPLLPDYC